MNQVSIAKVVQVLNAHLDKEKLKLLCLDLNQTYRLPRSIDTTLGIVEWMMNQLLISLGYRPNQTVNLSNLANATRRIGCVLLASELERLNTGIENAREKTCIENIVTLLMDSTHSNTLETICKLLKINMPMRSNWEIEQWLQQIRDFGDDLERLGSKMERDYRSSKENPARRNLNLERLVDALAGIPGGLAFFKINTSHQVSSHQVFSEEQIFHKLSMVILRNWTQFDMICKLANVPPPTHPIYDTIYVWLRTYFGKGTIHERVGSNLQRQYDNSIKYPHARNEPLEKLYQEFVAVEGAAVMFKMNLLAEPTLEPSFNMDSPSSPPKRVKKIEVVDDESLGKEATRQDATALTSVAFLMGKTEAAARSWLDQPALTTLVQQQVPLLFGNHKNLSSLLVSLTEPWGSLIHAVLEILTANKLSNQAILRGNLKGEIDVIVRNAHPVELFVWKLDAPAASDLKLVDILEQRKKYLSANLLKWIGADFFAIAGEDPMDPVSINAQHWQELFGKFYANIEPGCPNFKDIRMSIMSKSDNVAPILTLETCLFPQVNIDFSQAVPSLNAVAGSNNIKADLEQCIVAVEKITPLPAATVQAMRNLLNVWAENELFDISTVDDLKNALRTLSQPPVPETSVLLVVKQLANKNIISIKP